MAPTRTKIKEGLALCTDAQRVIFCRMYAPKEYFQDQDNFIYNNKALDKYNIDEVVYKRPTSKLKTALNQVERTITKRGKNGTVE